MASRRTKSSADLQGDCGECENALECSKKMDNKQLCKYENSLECGKKMDDKCLDQMTKLIKHVTGVSINSIISKVMPTNIWKKGTSCKKHRKYRK